MNDLGLALNLQAQYDGKIPSKLLNGVSYSILNIEPGVLDLLFEGSHDISDAKRDLEAFMGNCPFGLVHQGAWLGIPEVIDAELNSLSPLMKIRCTGHSRGAQQAQLAYRELYRRGYTNLECITFECPRFGDMKAVLYASDVVDNRTYQNYKNLFESDFFTMIPVHLALEPYAEVPNCTRYWQAPSANNEYKEFPLNIQAHSLEDCVLPYLKTICPCTSPS
jgi:hypothetical protein